MSAVIWRTAEPVPPDAALEPAGLGEFAPEQALTIGTRGSPMSANNTGRRLIMVVNSFCALCTSEADVVKLFDGY
jgi:hypothetical protein